jgi:methionyl-tRNA formyltransferase
MRLAWIGFHVEGVPALRALCERRTDLVAVLTHPAEQAAGKSGHADIAGLCAEYGVPVHVIRSVNDPAAVDLLRSLDLDLAFVIGWTQIVRRDALATARLGMVGAHASLLPRDRGRAPVNWALIRGDERTGNTLLWLAEGADEGDIIEQTVIPITPHDTCGTIYEQVAASNRDMILRLLERLDAGERPGSPQPPVSDPPLPGRKPEDGAIDWSADARTVYDFIRAITRPYPGAFSTMGSTTYRIWSAAVLPGSERLGAPGEVLGPVLSPDEQACGQLVACGRGALIVLELEDPHGRIIRGREWYNRHWTGERWHHG